MLQQAFQKQNIKEQTSIQKIRTKKKKKTRFTALEAVKFTDFLQWIQMLVPLPEEYSSHFVWTLSADDISCR